MSKTPFYFIISDDLKRRFKEYCAEEDKTMTEVLEKTIRQLLEPQQTKEPHKEFIEPIYKKHVKRTVCLTESPDE